MLLKANHICSLRTLCFSFHLSISIPPMGFRVQARKHSYSHHSLTPRVLSNCITIAITYQTKCSVCVSGVGKCLSLKLRHPAFFYNVVDCVPVWQVQSVTATRWWCVLHVRCIQSINITVVKVFSRIISIRNSTESNIVRVQMIVITVETYGKKTANSTIMYRLRAKSITRKTYAAIHFRPFIYFFLRTVIDR